MANLNTRTFGGTVYDLWKCYPEILEAPEEISAELRDFKDLKPFVEDLIKHLYEDGDASEIEACLDEISTAYGISLPNKSLKHQVESNRLFNQMAKLTRKHLYELNASRESWREIEELNTDALNFLEDLHTQIRDDEISKELILETIENTMDLLAQSAWA